MTDSPQDEVLYAKPIIEEQKKNSEEFSELQVSTIRDDHSKNCSKPPLYAKPNIYFKSNAKLETPLWSICKENAIGNTSILLEEQNIKSADTKHVDENRNSKQKLPAKPPLYSKPIFLQNSPKKQLANSENRIDKYSTIGSQAEHLGGNNMLTKTVPDSLPNEDFVHGTKHEECESKLSILLHNDESNLPERPPLYARPIIIQDKTVKAKPPVYAKPKIAVQDSGCNLSKRDNFDNKSDNQINSSGLQKCFDNISNENSADIIELADGSNENKPIQGDDFQTKLAGAVEELRLETKNEDKKILSGFTIAGKRENQTSEIDASEYKSDIAAPESVTTISDKSNIVNIVKKEQEMTTEDMLDSMITPTTRCSSKKPIPKPRRPPPPVLHSKDYAKENNSIEEEKTSMKNVVKGTPLDRRKLPATPQSKPKMAIQNVSLEDSENQIQKEENSDDISRNDQGIKCLNNKLTNEVDFVHESRFSLSAKTDETTEGRESAMHKASQNIDTVEKETKRESKKVKDKTDGFKIPFVRRRNKAHLKELKEERKSCPPLSDMASEETWAEIQESVEDKWKCKSFTSAKEIPGDYAEGELLQRLETQRKRTELRKGNTLDHQNKEKMLAIQEDEEMEDADLFDHVLVVKLKQGNNGLEPFISFRFPPKQKYDKEVDPRVASIPQFCFPDLKSGMSDHDYREEHAGYQTNETFSFVLTDMVGKRHFGYCRQIQMTGSATARSPQGLQLPEVYCIVSPYGLFGLYSQILDEVERQCTFSSTSVFSFLKAVLSHSLPRPGRSVEISFFSGGSQGIKSITLHRGGDSAIHEHVDFKLLFDSIPINMIVQILSALLLERRIILASSQLSLLSVCCHAFVSLLYPFQWQHTYIPVLPHQLLDMCCLPTPYLLGVLSGSLEDLDDLPLDEVIIVDLDAAAVIRNDQGEHDSSFPMQIKNLIDSSLTKILQKDVVIAGNEERNMIITEIFMDSYLHFIGNFQEFYSEEAEDGSGFKSLNFAKSSKSKEQQKFMKQFVKTQAFQFFIRQYNNQNSDSKGLFEERLQDWHISKKSKGAEKGWHRMLGKLKVLHR